MMFFAYPSILARSVLFLCSSAASGWFASAVSAAPVQGYVMAIQMTPAVCMLDMQSAKKRKCLEGYSLNISGLFPETTQVDCKTSSSAALSPLQAKVVARIMPDETARVQLWRAIGGCVLMSASQYFRTVINYAERLKVPTELTMPETQKIQLDSLRLQFLRLNRTLPSNAIKFNCTTYHAASILTELKLCYKNDGSYKPCPTTDRKSVV